MNIIKYQVAKYFNVGLHSKSRIQEPWPETLEIKFNEDGWISYILTCLSSEPVNTVLESCENATARIGIAWASIEWITEWDSKSNNVNNPFLEVQEPQAANFPSGLYHL